MGVAVLAAASIGCTTTVPGHPVGAGSIPGDTRAALSAEGLLLPDGSRTPLGQAQATEVGGTYFTRAEPVQCSAAVLFKGSPLPPEGATDDAESAFLIKGTVALYAESVKVYDRPLAVADVVRAALSAVTACDGAARGISPSGGSGEPMQLSRVVVPSDGVLVWSLVRSDWSCGYGLAVIPAAVLMTSLCDRDPGFDMADWATARRSQIQRLSV